ncbi:protein of unknown function (plasmid) [Cupriavidus taiwanensis]|nr:protein of unknown function [Cupriavidus taiwanensis]
MMLLGGRGEVGCPRGDAVDFVDAPALTPAPLPQAGEGRKPAAASSLQAFQFALGYSLSRLRERVGVRAGVSTK